MDYVKHWREIYRFKNGMLPSDLFRRNVVLSFQEDAIGIRLPPPFPPPLAGEGRVGVSTT